MPQVGDIVIFYMDANEAPSNGTREHPAVISRVWSEQMVNLTVFPDLGAPYTCGSVLSIDAEARSEFAAYWKPKD